MFKWYWSIIIVSFFSVNCNINKTTEEIDKTFSWELPHTDLKTIPPANYKLLTQVYDDFSLENRDVTYRDERLLTMRGIDETYFKFPEYKTKSEWEKRKNYLRERILVCAGLWPLPPKTPLHPKFYDEIDHEDYVVKTVTIQPFPGFYLGGNLYLPKSEGKHPAILTPHGHFEYGRLTNDSITSIPGRCINFAKQGYVVFAYDMVGYNDTKQVSHTFAKDSISSLYGINLLGLQLWNSMRALDFISSLPEVDTSRMGMTGASGGGTQTFLLTAVDDRIAVSAPVNMVSNVMQGGDLCENAPGLRINTFNVEIASMVAPKPLLLVSNTQDWTYNTRNTIMPMVQSIYKLYNAESHLKNEHFDYPHNYNKSSREAVYPWFGKWLLHDDNQNRFREKPFQVDSSRYLLAFMNNKTSDRNKTFEELPSGDYHNAPTGLNEDGLKNLMKNIYKEQLNKYWPKTKEQLKEFKYLYGDAVKQLLGVQIPASVDCRILKRGAGSDFVATQIVISKKNKNEWIPCVLFQPKHAETSAPTLILTSDQGKSGWVNEGSSEPVVSVQKLLKKGFNVLLPDLFNQGENILQDSTATRRNEKSNFFTTYNLTDKQNQIQDILTLIEAIKENKSLSPKINLWATGNTGIVGLLLASIENGLNKIVIDGDQFDPSSDQNMLSLQIPGIMRVGGVPTVLALASIKEDTRLLLYNTNPLLESSEVVEVSKLREKGSGFSITQEKIDDDKIINFLAN